MSVPPRASPSIKNPIMDIDKRYGKNAFNSEDVHIIAKPEASEVKEYRKRLPIFNHTISFTRIYKGNDPNNVLLLTGGFGGTRGGFIDTGFVKSLIRHWPPEQKRPDVVYVHWPHHKAPPPFRIDPDFKKLIPFMQASLENATNTFPPLQRKRLILVNHSLGCPFMHAVVAKSPALQDKVTCFFDIAPAFNGPKFWLEKLIRWTPLRFKGLLGNFIKNKHFSDAEQEYKKAYREQPAQSYSLTSPDDAFIHPHSPHWSPNNISFTRSPAKESGLAYSRMDGTHRSIIDQTAGHWIADIFRSNHLSHATKQPRENQKKPSTQGTGMEKESTQTIPAKSNSLIRNQPFRK